MRSCPSDAPPVTGGRPGMKSGLARLDGALGKVEEMALAAMLAVMLLTTTAVILSRYIQPLGMGYLSDLAVGLIPWTGMLGAAVALKHGRHIGMTALRDRLTPQTRRAVVTAAQLAILGILAVIVWAGWLLVARQLASGVATPAMELPRWLISLSLPAGGALAMVHQAVQIALGDPNEGREAGAAYAVAAEGHARRGSAA